MSNFSAVSKIEQMEELLAEAKKEADRFDRGMKIPGTTVRKLMQDIRKLARDTRDGIKTEKSNRIPDPEKSARARERSVFCQ